MKRLLALWMVLCFSLAGHCYEQGLPLPADFEYDLHTDMRQYTKYVLPCIAWLEQAPMNGQKQYRDKLDNFILHWLQLNPDLEISLPEYSFALNNTRREFLMLFFDGYIRHVLETKETSVAACSMAGLNDMLDYYQSDKAASAGRFDYLDSLAQIRKDGKLKDLFDTARTAENTFLFLKDPGRRHDFKYDENYLRFQFYTINLLRPRAIKYRYMLEGYYNDWISTIDGTVIFPRLPPGNYRFRVQSSMYKDFEYPVEKDYAFNIGGPLWKETWFLALVSAAGVLLAYLIIRQREQHLKNLAMLQQERVVFEYEHLKSQVNPHFLFNSLNTLANLIARDQQKAIRYTEDLSRLYHQVLSYRDKDLILLSEELAILDNYILIQKGRFGDGLQLQIDIPAETMNTRKIVPMALQILIENAIKHNIVSASEPLLIYVSAGENEITIRNAVRPKMSQEKGAGLGLLNIKRRYELLTRKTVVYGLHEQEYVVILPLL